MCSFAGRERRAAILVLVPAGRNHPAADGRRDPSRRRKIVKRTLIPLAAALAVAALPATALAQGAGGVTGPAFYVNGELYRTVGTPTDLSATGAPDASYDVIYSFGGAQRNVATAAPGDGGFNGGRWHVHALAFNSTYAAALAAHDADVSGAIDTNAELWSALGDAGATGISDAGIVKSFVCPVIQIP
jgi:hypothetical protein